jgi:mannose-1-phosphate guanylyltransferase/phosphomannomutase
VVKLSQRIQNLNELYKNGRIVGKANYIFTPEIASSIGSIHGSSFKVDETVVIGRDYHNDSRMLKRGYTSGMMSTGINVLNLSDCTFPLLEFTIRRFGASGGTYFSGGHLYSEDVGVRFADAGGIELAPLEIKKIIDSYNTYPAQIRRVDPRMIGRIIDIPQTQDVYIKSLEQFVNKIQIKDANLKIVVDCSFSPTGKVTPLLINEVGVEVIALNTHYRERSKIPVPSVNTIKNTAEIVKASNSHLGVCFDVDGSRILVLDENGLEISFEDLLMLFIAYDQRIKNSKNSPVIITPSVSPVIKNFIEESGHPIKLVENYPGELSRQIRQERACFAAADSLKFYFPSYAPFSDGNFTLLKILEIMAVQKDLISSLTKGFPKGIKVNKTIPVSAEIIDGMHNRLIEFADEHDLKYQDIINELKIMDDDVYVKIKVALNRNAVLLSAESEDKNKSEKMILKLSKIIAKL